MLRGRLSILGLLVAAAHASAAEPLVLAAAADAAEPEPAATADILPVDFFARPDDSGELLISPDGTHAAQSVVVDGASAIAVYALDPFRQVKLLPSGDDLRIFNVRWATPTRLVFAKAERSEGATRSIGAIFAVDIDGQHPKVLRAGYSYSPFTELVGSHADEENDVLAIEYPKSGSYKPRLVAPTSVEPSKTAPRTSPQSTERTRDEYRQPVLQRLDIYTGDVTPVDELAGMPPGDADVLLDDHDRARFAVGSKRRDYVLMWRPGDEWVPFEPAGFERRTLVAQHYSAAAHTLYFTGSQDGRPNALYTIDAGTAVVKQVYAHPTADVIGVVTSLDGASVVGAAVYADRPEHHWLQPDDPAAAIGQALDRAFPDEAVGIASISRDQRRAIAVAYSDVDPGAYYLVDVQSGKADRVVAMRPWIDPAKMRHKEVIEIKARDGMVLHGYLTRPRDGEGAVPLVLMPHFGPERTRSLWDYESTVQLLAHYGYAVLQVNYRGSAGYGEAFRRAGFGEWGRKMQTDLTDATLWAIERGIAQRANVCVFGYGYGGYAALMASVQQPGLYGCAISQDGIIDLERLRNEYYRWHSLYTAEEIFGNDMQSLRERSPLYNAQRIETQVLLIARTSNLGDEIEDAKRMRRALEKADRKVESHTLRVGDDVSAEASTRSLFVAVLDFLARHLQGGRAPTKQ